MQHTQAHMANTGPASAAAAAHEGHDDMMDIGSPAAGSAADSSSSSSHPKRALDDGADDSKEQPPAKRGLPRHFAASSAKQLPHLHRDVLQSMFAFLQQKEFALLTRVSKEWLSTAVQMPSRQWWYACSTESALHRLLVSPLRRHVSSFQYRTQWGFPPTDILSATQLLTISDRMAHLGELGCRIRLTAGMAPPHWPAKLTKLNLHLQLATDVPEEVAALLSLVGESLARQAPLVEEFEVRCDDKSERVHPLSGELLSPLLQWQLKEITFAWDGEIASSAYPILRRMAHLTRLRLGRQLQQQFVDLMSLDGPVPPLEELQLFGNLDATDAIVPLLLKLPTLRNFQASFSLADPTPLVPVLRRLHTLFVARQPTCQLDSFVSALQQCTQLTDLTLANHELAESHLTAILPPLRQLAHLGVYSRGVRSLAFLAAIPHLAETLTLLKLGECELDPVELRHFRPLRALVDLRLNECLTSPLDADTVSTMTPGDDGFMKDLWPNLRTFVCRV